MFVLGIFCVFWLGERILYFLFIRFSFQYRFFFLSLRGRYGCREFVIRCGCRVVRYVMLISYYSSSEGYVVCFFVGTGMWVDVDVFSNLGLNFDIFLRNFREGLQDRFLFGGYRVVCFRGYLGVVVGGSCWYQAQRFRVGGLIFLGRVRVEGGLSDFFQVFVVFLVVQGWTFVVSF